MKKNKFYSIIIELVRCIKFDSTLMEMRRSFFYQNILRYYRNTKNAEIKEIVDVIKRNNQLNIFNYDFYNKYQQMKVEVQYDKEAGMHYILRGERALYFKRGMSSDEVLEYYKGICAEQDENSPHRYLSDDNVAIEKGDVVLDLGGAEGNFVFDNLDKISKAIIVECEESWIEALKMTFKSSSKVIIVNKMIAAKTDKNNISLDDLVKKYSNGIVNFVKMDIEGMEAEALQGSKDILHKGAKFAICTYHNNNDYKKIAAILKDNNYKISHSKGFMTPYMAYNFGKPYLRRGVIMGTRI